MKTQWKFVLVGVGAFVLGGVCDRLLFEEITDYFNIEKAENHSKGVVSLVENLQMEDGFIYTGELDNGKRHGTGRMITPKGTIYEGEWIDNQMIFGTMITEKAEYNGDFKGLSPDGYGVMYYKDGSYYRGNWKRGAKSGIGLLVDSLGHKLFGRWERGLIDRETQNTNVEDVVYGIDLSHHNYIEKWGDIALYRKNNGRISLVRPEKDFFFHPISFVFTKATEGATHRDKKYIDNMFMAKKHYLVRGSYHFMHLTSSSPEEQAANFLDYLIYESGDLPPVLDIEVMEQAQKIGVEETQKKVLKWLQIVEKELNVKPIIYTSTNMRKKFFSSKKFAQYKFWMAHYTDKYPSDSDYLIWQFTDKGAVYGIPEKHKLDINVFGGTYRDFVSLCKK